jgi:hypothetical protein
MDFGSAHPPVHEPNTHIPDELHAEITQGSVVAIYFETLKLGGLASRVLPGEPKCVVTGIVTQLGELVVGRPKSLTRLFWTFQCGGLTLCVVGGGLVMAATWAFAGMLSFAIGALALKSSFEIPNPARATRRLSTLL